MSECLVYFPFGLFLIPLSYVCLINAFYDHRKPRDHLPNVRRRFLAASLVSLVSIGTAYFLLGWLYEDPLKQMGFHWTSLFPALTLPSLLTLLFYTGTLATLAMEGCVPGWHNLITDPLWIRQAIMAPLTEELTFRACLAPLLRHCLSEFAATFVVPISFSLSHIHHIFGDYRAGKPLNEALAQRAFQMLYTYLFGVYATHVFFQTGHILAPILCHSICNLLEIPSVGELPLNVPKSRQLSRLLYALHFGGFLGWFLLRPFLLCPDLYHPTN